MIVTIDQDRCAGHGACCATSPEVFTLTDDGYAEVQSPDVPAHLEQAVRTAVSQCPEKAISAS